MQRKPLVPMTIALTLLIGSVSAQPPAPAAPAAAPAPAAAGVAADTRVFVEMPAAAQQLMRQDMLSHLAALNSIIAALGSGDLNTAADTAPLMPPPTTRTSKVPPSRRSRLVARRLIAHRRG